MTLIHGDSGHALNRVAIQFPEPLCYLKRASVGRSLFAATSGWLWGSSPSSVDIADAEVLNEIMQSFVSALRAVQRRTIGFLQSRKPPIRPSGTEEDAKGEQTAVKFTDWLMASPNAPENLKKSALNLKQAEQLAQMLFKQQGNPEEITL
jgi:hypothetical protein